jgi:hypothetical protein
VTTSRGRDSHGSTWRLHQRQPGAEAASAIITLDAGASCGREEVRDPASERPQETDRGKHRDGEPLEKMTRAHRHAASRDRDPVASVLVALDGRGGTLVNMPESDPVKTRQSFDRMVELNA